MESLTLFVLSQNKKQQPNVFYELNKSATTKKCLLLFACLSHLVVQAFMMIMLW